MKRVSGIMAALILASSMGLVVVDHADARRSGSFGSRGARTFQAPKPTPTAPSTSPIERSTTPRSQTADPSAASRQSATAQRPGGFFGNGFAGSMMRGLMIGGLIGLLLGHGLGGLAGMLGLIVQIGLAMLIATLVMRWFANRRSRPAQPARSPYPAMAPAGPATNAAYDYNGTGSATPMNSAPSTDVVVEQRDLDRFEQMLMEVQVAFSREDHAALRARTTPEVMSFLSEELDQNAASGVRNEVSDVKLLQGDVSESWHEGDVQYATVAMRYESRDVMRDRATNHVVSGEGELTETAELWTFVRPSSGDWKLTAIQDA